MSVSLKRKTPYINQLKVLQGNLNNMADEILECIHMIDEGDSASARSDLVAIYEEFKGDNDERN